LVALLACEASGRGRQFTLVLFVVHVVSQTLECNELFVNFGVVDRDDVGISERGLQLVAEVFTQIPGRILKLKELYLHDHDVRLL
jgi:hypothetical protein